MLLHGHKSNRNCSTLFPPCYSLGENNGLFNEASNETQEVSTITVCIGVPK